MLDQHHIGHSFPPFTVEVERGRIKHFAQAIGESSAIYRDEEAAIAAGYKTIPAPPTFPMVIDFEGQFAPIVKYLNLDIGKILHGSQAFDYKETIYAGDNITMTQTIQDIYAKQEAALEFVVLENSYVNQHKVLVAQAFQTLIYRNAK